MRGTGWAGRALGALGLALLTGGSLAAQTPRDGPAGEPPLALPRAAQPIVPDGEIGEAEWAGAVEIVGMMHLPDFGAEPTERTEFLMAYDDDYLYIGCRAYDSDPGAIRVTTLERDVAIFNTDACGLRLDSYN